MFEYATHCNTGRTTKYSQKKPRRKPQKPSKLRKTIFKAMAHLKFDQIYSKSIFYNSRSQNLKPVKNYEKFHWIIFIVSLIYLWKQLFRPKSKSHLMFLFISRLVFSKL